MKAKHEMRSDARTRDVVRHLSTHDLSLSTVDAVDRREAKKVFAGIRLTYGLSFAPVALLSDPSANVKLSHSSTDRVLAYGLNLLPADSHGAWNTCRYATPGCRSACLATSGQAGMERRAGKDRIYRARKAKLSFLAEHPTMFLALLLDEIRALPSKTNAALRKLDLGTDGWVISVRMNVLSDIPWETLAPWLYSVMRELGIRSYDYTAWPTARRNRSLADNLGLYLVDSVKETHTESQIRAMARPVVVFSTTRKGELPATYLGRRVIDADVSDARFLDEENTIRGLRFKHVASTSAAAAIASGFVKVA